MKAERKNVLGFTLQCVAIATMVHLSTLVFLPAHSTGLAHGSDSFRLTDIVVNNPAIEEDVIFATRSRLSEFENVSMFMYIAWPSRQAWLYFIDHSTGDTSHVLLPEFDISGFIPQAEHVLTSLREVLIFSNTSSSATIWEYALMGSPLPTSATLVWNMPFGNDDSRTRSFIELQSGGLLAVWYQQTSRADRSVDLGFAYRNPAGKWSSVFPVSIDGSSGGGMTSNSIAMAQHPADKSIWVFSKRDSYKSIEVVHLSEDEAGISIDWIDHHFITKQADRGNAPEGERPDLVAVADPARGTILLAYQNRQYYIYSTDYFVKGSYVTIAEIRENRSKSFVTFPVDVERITRLGLIAKHGKVWLAFRPITEADFPDVLYVSSYDFHSKSWSPPIFIDSLYRDPSYSNNAIPPAFGTSRLDIVTKIADGYIHYFQLESDK